MVRHVQWLVLHLNQVGECSRNLYSKGWPGSIGKMNSVKLRNTSNVRIVLQKTTPLDSRATRVILKISETAIVPESLTNLVDNIIVLMRRRG